MNRSKYFLIIFLLHLSSVSSQGTSVSFGGDHRHQDRRLWGYGQWSWENLMFKLNVCEIDPGCPFERHHPHHKVLSGYCHSCPRCNDWDPSDVKSPLGKYCSQAENLSENDSANDQSSAEGSSGGNNVSGGSNINDSTGGSGNMNSESSMYSETSSESTSSGGSSNVSSNGESSNISANDESSNTNNGSSSYSSSNSQETSSNSAYNGDYYNEANGSYQNRNSDSQGQGYENESISYVSSSSSSSNKNSEASDTETTSHSQHSAADDSDFGSRAHTTYDIVNKRTRRLKIFLTTTMALSFLIFASSTFMVLKMNQMDEGTRTSTKPTPPPVAVEDPLTLDKSRSKSDHLLAGSIARRIEARSFGIFSFQETVDTDDISLTTDETRFVRVEEGILPVPAPPDQKRAFAL